jgi:hypothetical protein
MFKKISIFVLLLFIAFSVFSQSQLNQDVEVIRDFGNYRDAAETNYQFGFLPDALSAELYIGQGVDVRDANYPEPTIDEVLTFDGELIDAEFEYEPLQNATSRYIEDVSQSRMASALHAYFGGSFGFGTLKAAYDYVRESSQTSHDIIFVQTVTTGNSMTRQNLELNPRAANVLSLYEADEDLEDSFDNMAQRFGTHYVDSITYGYRIVIHGSVQSTDESVIQNFRAHFKNLTVNGGVDTSREEFFRNYQVEIYGKISSSSSSQIHNITLANLSDIATVIARLKVDPEREYDEDTPIAERPLIINPGPIACTVTSIRPFLYNYPRLYALLSPFESARNHAVEDLPYGSVVLWTPQFFYRNLRDIEDELPLNWKICDGRMYESFQTPDLRNRFIMNTSVMDQVGALGGSESHQHEGFVEANEDSQRAHIEKDDGHSGALTSHTHTITTEETSHLPPYYTGIYVIKLPLAEPATSTTVETADVQSADIEGVDYFIRNRNRNDNAFGVPHGSVISWFPYMHDFSSRIPVDVEDYLPEGWELTLGGMETNGFDMPEEDGLFIMGTDSLSELNEYSYETMHTHVVTIDPGTTNAGRSDNNSHLWRPWFNHSHPNVEFSSEEILPPFTQLFYIFKPEPTVVPETLPFHLDYVDYYHLTIPDYTITTLPQNLNGGIAIGQGVSLHDIDDPRVKPGNLLVMRERDAEQTSGSGSNQIHRFIQQESSRKIAQTLFLNFGSSFGFTSYGATYREVKMEEENVEHIIYILEYMDGSLSPYRGIDINPEMVPLLEEINRIEDPTLLLDVFTGHFGSHYISQINTGYRVAIHGTIRSSSSSARQEFQAHFRSLTYDARLTASAAEFFNNNNVNIYCNVMAGASTSEGAFTLTSFGDIARFLQERRNENRNVRLTPAPISCKLENYRPYLQEYENIYNALAPINGERAETGDGIMELGAIPWIPEIRSQNFYDIEDALPVGWVICDGRTYGDFITPNLVNRFVRGFASVDDIDAYGGNETHSHSGTTGPSESRSGNEYDHSSYYRISPPGHTHRYSTDEASNIPAYWKLIYIIKLPE